MKAYAGARSKADDERRANAPAETGQIVEQIGPPPAGLSIGPVRRSSDENDPLGGTEVPAGTLAVLRRRRGGGRSLPEQLAQPLGQQFGADLSAVRVHADTESAEVSRSLQATAFTHGTDIYFGPGAYDPTSAAGQKVLVHELAHVMQQGRSSTSRAGSTTTVGRADDPAEADADAVAHDVLHRLRDPTVSVPAPDPALTPAAGDRLGALRRRAIRVDHGAGDVVRRIPEFLKKLRAKLPGGQKPVAALTAPAVAATGPTPTAAPAATATAWARTTATAAMPKAVQLATARSAAIATGALAPVGTPPATAQGPATGTPAVTTPAVTTPAVTTPAVTTPAVTTPAVTPAVTTPAVTTPAVTAVTTPAVTTPAVVTPALTTPAVTIPAVTTPLTTPASTPAVTTTLAVGTAAPSTPALAVVAVPPTAVKPAKQTFEEALDPLTAPANAGEGHTRMGQLRALLGTMSSADRTAIAGDKPLLAKGLTFVGPIAYMALLAALDMNKMRKPATGPERKFHLSGAEADVFIAQEIPRFAHLVPYFQAAIAAGKKGEGYIASVDEDDWNEVYAAQFTAGDPSDPVGGAMERSTNAFVGAGSPDNPAILHKDRGTPSTAIHESMHRYSDMGGVLVRWGFNLNEGMTEYFTRLLTNQNAESATSGPERTNYQQDVTFVRSMIRILGANLVQQQTVLADIYFKGELDKLEACFKAAWKAKQSTIADTELGTKWTDFNNHLHGSRWSAALALMPPP